MSKTKEDAVDTSPQTKAYFQVIEYIRMLVQNGEISIGEKLPSERQLMTTLGLSRNSIREAFRSLENLGILESHHGQGNFLVNHASQSLGSMFSLLLFMKECNLTEISQLRRTIEIGACLLGAKQAPDTKIQALSQSLHEMELGSREERTKLDKNFHDTLIQISENRLLELLNETLSQLFENTIDEILSHISDTDWNDLLACHVRIYESLVTRNVSSCIAAILEHYDRIDRYNVTDSHLRCSQ